MEQLTLPFQEEILKGKQEQHHQQLEGMFFYQTQVCLVCNLLSVVWLMMWYWNITYVAHLMQANHTLWTSAACCLKMKILFSIVSSLLAWRWKRLFLFSASYLLFEVCCKWRAAARFNVGRVCRERLNALPQTSYLSRISRIISVEKILSCGEISDFCKEFEQFMALYRNLCRFCSWFVWRKIRVEKISVEKKWQIWGLVKRDNTNMSLGWKNLTLVAENMFQWRKRLEEAWTPEDWDYCEYWAHRAFCECCQ